MIKDYFPLPTWRKIALSGLLAWLGLTSALAQVPDAFNRSGVYVSVGQMRNRSLTNESLDRFINTYNSRFASLLASPLPNINFDNSSYWSFGLFLYYLDMEYGFAPLRQTMVADFNDGRTRHIDFNARQQYLRVGLTLPTDLIRIGAFLSMNTNKGQVRSKMIYPNGMESYGMESSYNGIFDVDQLDLGYGFKASIGYKYVFFTFQAEKIGLQGDFWLPEDQQYKGTIGIQDELGLGGDSPYYNNHTFPTFLSQNAAVIPDPGNSAIAEGLVNGELSEWRFSFGITFSLTSEF
ncbi:MAG: hypothetical protein AAF927_02990 [Bacteroidota bacterium]